MCVGDVCVVRIYTFRQNYSYKWFWLQSQTSENDLIPYSDTFHCYRLIFYKLILKRCVMVILKLLKVEIFQKYNMLIIRELKEHISFLMKILVSHEEAKEIDSIKRWSNAWKSCETKTTAQSKSNAHIYLYNASDPQCIEDSSFLGCGFLFCFFVWRNTMWPIFYLIKSNRGPSKMFKGPGLNSVLTLDEWAGPPASSTLGFVDDLHSCGLLLGMTTLSTSQPNGLFNIMDAFQSWSLPSALTSAHNGKRLVPWFLYLEDDVFT